MNQKLFILNKKKIKTVHWKVILLPSTNSLYYQLQFTLNLISNTEYIYWLWSISLAPLPDVSKKHNELWKHLQPLMSALNSHYRPIIAAIEAVIFGKLMFSHEIFLRALLVDNLCVSILSNFESYILFMSFFTLYRPNMYMSSNDSFSHWILSRIVWKFARLPFITQLIFNIFQNLIKPSW